MSLHFKRQNSLFHSYNSEISIDNNVYIVINSLLNMNILLQRALEKRRKKWEKSIIIWIFFNLGKIGNLTTPPLGPNLGKIWNWEQFWTLGTPPQICWAYSQYFCPALTKLALDLHVNFCLFVCLSVCLSGLFFKASNWIIYWLLTVVLATYLSD